MTSKKPIPYTLRDFHDKVRKARAEREERNETKKYLVVTHVTGETLLSFNKREHKVYPERRYWYCSLFDIADLLQYTKKEFVHKDDSTGEPRFGIIDDFEIYPLSKDLVDSFIEMYEEEDVLDAHRELCKERDEEAKLKIVA